jgi:hypothetical protein
MATRGEAADYYNSGPAPGPGKPQYDQRFQEPQYGQQPPPQYGQNFGPSQGAPAQDGYGQNGGYGEKPTFEQKFAIPKPKFNDLWAGLLVC